MLEFSQWCELVTGYNRRYAPEPTLRRLFVSRLSPFDAEMHLTQHKLWRRKPAEIREAERAERAMYKVERPRGAVGRPRIVGVRRKRGVSYAEAQKRIARAVAGACDELLGRRLDAPTLAMVREARRKAAGVL